MWTVRRSVAARCDPDPPPHGPEAGDPDLPSIVNGTTAIGAVHGNPLASGMWAAAPSELGPTPSARRARYDHVRHRCASYYRQ
jgi:hypothetical protein